MPPRGGCGDPSVRGEQPRGAGVTPGSPWGGAAHGLLSQPLLLAIPHTEHLGELLLPAEEGWQVCKTLPCLASQLAGVRSANPRGLRAGGTAEEVQSWEQGAANV